MIGREEEVCWGRRQGRGRRRLQSERDKANKNLFPYTHAYTHAYTLSRHPTTIKGAASVANNGRKRLQLAHSSTAHQRAKTTLTPTAPKRKFSVGIHWATWTVRA